MALVVAHPDPYKATLTAIDGLTIGNNLTATPLLAKILKANRAQVDIYALALTALDASLAPHSNTTQVRKRHPQLDPLIVYVLVNDDRPTEAPVATTALDSLSHNEASEISKSFNAFLHHKSLRPRAAVREWIENYPPLTELSASQPFFRPLIEVIADRHYKDSNFRKSYVKLSIGATLSILDMISDIVVIIDYKASGNEDLESAGNFLLSLLVINVAMQLLTVVGQNKNTPKSVLMWELLYVVTCTKVGVDAYRVATGVEQDPHTRLDPKTVLAFVKSEELTTEAIPGCILQIAALLRMLLAGRRPGVVTVLSILVSAASAGFTCASMTMDFDTDTAKRKKTPKFFGMIPDDPLKKNIIFACMMLNSSLLLIFRCIGAAFLIQTNRMYFVSYLLADHALYWLYLFARNDAWVFVNVTGPFGAFIAFFARVVWKIAVDYTGIVQFRLPGLVGGLYYSVNTVTAFLATFGAIYIFFEKNSEVDARLEKVVWMIAIALGVVFVLSFTVFLFLIDRKYLQTFYSPETTHEWVQSYYLEGTTDEVRYGELVHYNPNCWKSIRSEVKADMLEKWEGWEANKPAWFDDMFMSNVDDEMVPPKFLRAMKVNGGGERRRSSMGEKIGVRVSARERVGVSTSDEEGGGAVVVDEEEVVAAEEGFAELLRRKKAPAWEEGT
jgi:hypothetical protein